jgi:hypothetical protein
VAVSSGCSGLNLGKGKQIQQLEMENNRLLSEFRAERQRREVAERTAQQLENRLAESEKLLARQAQSMPGRLSSLPSASPAGPTFGGSPSGFPGTGYPSGFSSGFQSGGSSSPANSDFRWQRRGR